jgi:hypothetical protein
MVWQEQPGHLVPMDISSDGAITEKYLRGMSDLLQKF